MLFLIASFAAYSKSDPALVAATNERLFHISKKFTFDFMRTG
jgi:hypothetical protein